MWASLVSIPVLGLAVMLQTTILSRINLLSGNADLILLILAAWALQERVKHAWVWALVAVVLVAFVSSLPWYIYLISYLTVVGVARLLTRSVWQAPLLAMFSVSLIGTLVLQMSTFVLLTLSQVRLSLGEVLAKIVLPSLLLNLLLAIPIHAVIRNLALQLFPTEAEL
jgi:hypothetical protein